MNKGGQLLCVENLTITRAGRNILNNISFSLDTADHLAIIGASGSGKTTLALALAGRVFYKGDIHFNGPMRTIAWVEQQHHFKTLSNTNDLYYQQRFNSYDSEETQTVKQQLGESEQEINEVLEIMKITHVADKPLIQLSNGENKKLQIAAALLSKPGILIMDQPFIGLDTTTRDELHQLIDRLANQGILIVLVTTPGELPTCITRVIDLGDGQIVSTLSAEETRKKYALEKNHPKPVVQGREWSRQLPPSRFPEFEFAIRMQNVNVSYGEKQVLRHVNWEVRKGERWLLSGPNGAGKSTLLSLVTADNPQAYANKIYLFDKKRGSGESIWDIKKKIGYLSPELHVFFDQSATCFETVASGLFDTIGLFRQLSAEDVEAVNDWMLVTGITAIRDKRLYELSTGQQRIVLLARALVKNPPLLILDEPCQGLDPGKEAELLELIDAVCIHGNKTMVFVTHYANERPACIDRFIRLEEGVAVLNS